jgi:RNA polymerase sigma-70 factor, ECF subfamily
MDSDTDLMLRVQQGDVDAFAVLVARHRQRLQRFMRRLCWNPEEAEDYAQEALARLWIRRAQYHPGTHFTTYLYTIARNCWLDCKRRERVRPRSVPLEAQLGPRARAELERMVAEAEPVTETVLWRYQLHKIRAAIAALPEGQRLVLILGHYEGLPYEQIGQILGIPEGTVKSRMHAAVRRLREVVEDDESA